MQECLAQRHGEAQPAMPEPHYHRPRAQLRNSPRIHGTRRTVDRSYDSGRQGFPPLLRNRIQSRTIRAGYIPMLRHQLLSKLVTSIPYPKRRRRLVLVGLRSLGSGDLGLHYLGDELFVVGFGDHVAGAVDLGAHFHLELAYIDASVH